MAIKSWISGSLIGSGAFGSVNLAVDSETGNLFAVKSVECGQDTAELRALHNELEILQSVSSPRVVKCLGSGWSKSVTTGRAVRNIFLEYMPGGSLSDLMSKLGGKLEECLVRIYTKEILQGLDYLHSHGIVHCDIKGKNVLVGTEGVKLADFGAAKKINSSSSVGSIKGTPLWMAPEVVRQEEQGPESDVWSLGCTVLEMVTGRSPWGDLTAHNMFSALYKIGCSDELPVVPSFLSEEGKDFVEKCLQRDPKQRWTCKELLEHPFVTGPIPAALGCELNTEELDDIPKLPVQKMAPPKLEVSSWNYDQEAPQCSSPASPATGKWIVVRSPQGGNSPVSDDAFNLLSDFGSEATAESSVSISCETEDSRESTTDSGEYTQESPVEQVLDGNGGGLLVCESLECTGSRGFMLLFDSLYKFTSNKNLSTWPSRKTLFDIYRFYVAHLNDLICCFPLPSKGISPTDSCLFRFDAFQYMLKLGLLAHLDTLLLHSVTCLHMYA